MNLTQNKRIILNIVATYGRSLFSLVCGLLTGRWVLMAMGEVDYGLRGVVGGLTFFVSFIISILAGSMGRFYAVAIGNAQSGGEEGLEECRAWFSTAVVIHTVLPTVLLIIGYPIGEWMVRHYLTIPPDRINACVWVWRWTCVNCWFGFTTAPFSSFYTAKQEIAELTIYNFVQTSLTVCFCWYMVKHPGDWLATYMFWVVMLGVIPQVIIVLRAALTFPECKFSLKYLHTFDRVRQLFSFAGWQTFGALGGIFRGQAVTILVNKYFGPKVNAATSVGGTISGQCNQLSGSMIGAFSPAIMNAWGRKDFDYARDLSYRVCRYGVLLMLLFVLPLVTEIDEVLELWLTTPPKYSSGLFLCVIVLGVIDKFSVGHMILVNANGKVALYQAVAGSCMILTFPCAWLAAEFIGSVYSIWWAMMITGIMQGIARIVLASRLVKMSVSYWMRAVFSPIVVVVATSLLIGFVIQWLMPQSFTRLVVTFLAVESVFIPLTWKVALTHEERNKVVGYVSAIFRGLKK